MWWMNVEWKPKFTNYSLCLPNVEWMLVKLPKCYYFFTSQGHQKGPDQLALEHPYGEFDDGFWKVERVLICFGKQWKTTYIGIYLFHIKLSICWWGYIISILYKTINFVWYGYGSIPINTIFRGMNIHFNPAILMWTTGVQGFDTLPYWDISILYKTIYMLMGNMVIYNIL